MRTTAAPVIALALAAAAHADVRLPAAFTDHMVLQRGQPIRVFGGAQAGEAVTAELRDAKGAAVRTGRTTALADGSFRVEMEALPATAEPMVLEVRGANAVKVEDVVVGDVWVAGGQSNMEWPLGATDAQAAEGKAIANDPLVRFMTAPHVTAARPAATVDAKWQVLTPESAPNLSAVGFWFAMDLRRDVKVPVGILSLNWGGTRIEPWIDLATLESLPATAEAVARQRAAVEAWNGVAPQDRDASHREAMKAFQAAGADWWRKVNAEDPGWKGRWFDPAHDATGEGWRTVNVPGKWSKDPEFADYDGTAWYRRDVEIPAAWAGKECTLHLGPIDDADVVFVDGKAVANTVEDWTSPRHYRIPASLTKAGKVTIVVEVLDLHGEGGFMGAPGDVRLACDAVGAGIPLAGEWRVRAGRRATDLPPAPARPARDQVPGTGYGDMASMFHGMIAPFAGYPVEGAIWYQGESNANNDAEAKAYADLLPLLVRSWRAAFGRPDMPFGVVSLAAFRAFTPEQPVSGHWPALRASQLATEAAVPNVGVVTTIDVGNAGDIHPRDKRTVGQRLAHWAMATAYGKPETAWHGPRARSINRNGEALEIEFDVEGGRLGTRDGKDPAGFALVDASGAATWATGTVVGANRVSLKVPAGTKPVAVRYAWQDNPANANLADTVHGLPAHPFRIDVPN